ncbi:MAG TPA: YciI family protein [Actinocrinis sp.]|nr:YciI family protein [Actinocrinis sp.]
MKYLLMIYGNQEKWSTIPAEDWPREIAKQDAYNKKYTATGELLGGYGLADAAAAKLVSRKDGAAVVSDGPYLETKEYMASFYLVDVESEERAYELAAQMPWADQNPTEVWPILHESANDV